MYRLLYFLKYILLLFVFPANAQISDSFESYSTQNWSDGSSQGLWSSTYNGYGAVGIQLDTNSQNKVLFQKPKASMSLGETHAALVLTQRKFKTPQFQVRTKVVQQLRKPQANAWETAWVLWNYVNDHHFYYFALKTNGWELGKVDNTKINPNGPECLWPKYLNCKYPGAQRYLATGSSIKAKIGVWYDVKIDQKNNRLAVYVNQKPIVQFVDQQIPYYSGRVGLYNEDAYVRFDNIQLIENLK